MSRGPTPCDCGRALVGAPFVRGRDCAKCWRLLNTSVVAQVPRPPCLHLGRQLSPFVGKPCSRTYACEKGHGEVCPSRECRACPDFAADA